ncbi:MAG TPA: hypothetical protein VL172_06855 [Kofleriaceae bacterium]|jgi:hypothetical protein|nr:hypothetical protein [Kofleriaceae bacterium]
MSGSDGDLGARLRDLALVEVDALLAGTDGDQRAALLAAYVDDLEDALAAARDRMAALVAEIAGGPDPLAVIDADAASRVRDGGVDLARRAQARLDGRARACRALAALDQLARSVVPRLIEAERQRAIG